MQVDIAAAGFTSSWEFSGSKRFASWAELRPWKQTGGLCILRTQDAAFDDAIATAIERTVRGIHGGQGRIDVHRVECGGDLGDPLPAILSSLEIHPELSAFEAREPLGLRFADQSCLFILSERAPIDGRVWERFVAVVDHFSKSTPATRLCVAVVDRRHAVMGEPAFDFSAGRATHLVLAGASELEESALWRGYLHHRASWEAGGAPAYAIELGDVLLDCVVGDDDSAESKLLEVAHRHLSSHFDVAEIQRHVENWIGNDGDRSIATVEDARAQLQGANVLWRPPGMQGLELRPWLSRALLKRPHVSPRVIWKLRHNLVCTPLATEVLAQCLHSESQIRMQLHGREDPGKLPTAAQDSFDRFRNGEDCFAVYPSAYPLPPSRPQDVWAFASLGETLRACPSGAVADLYWDTLRLRNAIAHGHYVGWTHIRRAWHHLRRFDRRI